MQNVQGCTNVATTQCRLPIETSDLKEKGLHFEALFAFVAPPCSSGLRALFGVFHYRGAEAHTPIGEDDRDPKCP